METINKYLDALEKLYRSDCATVSPNPKCGDCKHIKDGNDCELYRSYLTLKESIDKEEPKEIHLAGPEFDNRFAACQKCHRVFDLVCEERYKYCPECGQRLDWAKLETSSKRIRKKKIGVI